LCTIASVGVNRLFTVFSTIFYNDGVADDGVADDWDQNGAIYNRRYCGVHDCRAGTGRSERQLERGGDWTLVAKTDNANGIAAINAFLQDVDNAYGPDSSDITDDDITLSTDIGAINPIDQGGLNERPPYLILGGGATDLLYGQDLSDPGSVVTLVGTFATSDGMDPLGDAAWDDATIIAFGTYSGFVPSFNSIDANELDQTSSPFSASMAVPTTSVVRVAVPEPASLALLLLACSSFAMRRRR